MANQIQASTLPSIFPAFPERTDFDVYASMNPAKEVGGDFYDFFFIDDKHLGLVMADVSGKGVPAALFMMISKTITFIDRGTPFDPLKKEDPDVTLSAEEREIGGLGIYMTKKAMDEVLYEYKDGQNRLTLIKKL